MKRYDFGESEWYEAPEGEWVRFEDAEQLRGTLSLAEEGLANATQEIEQLKADNERLRHRCAALAFLQYGGPSPGAECSDVPQPREHG